MPVILYKPLSVTPFELVKAYRLYAKIPNYVPVGYAGRLDPQAEGILILLVGEENKERKTYERLSKSYDFSVLFGIESDTYDIMGLPLFQKQHASITTNKIHDILPHFLGAWDQKYPPYSSVRVNGKPLFYWARKQQLTQIHIPSKKIAITDLKLLNSDESVLIKDLIPHIVQRVSRVQGNFRQAQIIEAWKLIEKLHPNQSVKLVHFSVSASNGLYVRSLARDIGKVLKTSSLAWSIKRTSVGKYLIKDVHHMPIDLIQSVKEESRDK